MTLQGFRSGGIRCASRRLVAVFLALGAAAAGFGPETAWAAAPQQAVVFDGSSAAADTFLVSVSSSGLFVDAGQGGLECSGASHVSSGGVLTLGPAQQGVFPSLSGLGSQLDAALWSQPQLPPTAIETYENDCDLVDDFATAQAYLSQARNDAQNLLTAIGSCLSDVEQTYCNLIVAIEQAAIVPPDPNSGGWVVNQFAPTEYGGAAAAVQDPMPWFFHCTYFSGKLADELPSYLDALALQLASCQDVHSGLLAILAEVGTELTLAEHYDLLAEADAGLAKAQQALELAQEDLDWSDWLVGEMTVQAVQNTCDLCDSSGEAPFRLLPSMALSLEADAGLLSLLVPTFQAAARDADDPNDAARWNAIASRMSNIPASRVVHVSHPAASQVGTHIVALRGGSLPPDAVSPLAVVVTAEVGAPWASEVNATDRHIVTEVLRAFVHTLDPNTRPNDEDDDDDGVRDAFETLTGTDPNRPDTDNDLFWDGTERAAGSDPNDPSSVPDRASPLSIPALATWGLIALSILVLAVVLTSQIMGRNASSYGQPSKADY